MEETQLNSDAPVWLRYSLAVAITVAAALLRWALPSQLAGTPYLVFYPAVVAAAAFAGGGPGLLATIAAIFSVVVLFGDTPEWRSVAAAVVVGRSLIFLIGGVGVSLVAELKRHAQARQRRQAQQAVELAAVVTSSNDAIVTEDPHGVVRTWNPAAEALFGYSAAEMVGKPIAVLAVPGEEDAMAKLLVAVRRGERVEHVDARRRRKDGSMVDISVSLSAMHDDAGRIIGITKIARDITERKRAEAEVHASKLSSERAKSAAEEANHAKDRFLAVLSHELRTPLTPVLAGLPMVLNAIGENHPMAETLDMMLRNMEMEARLIDDLLDVTRIAHGKIELDRKPIPLSTVLHRAVEVCKPDIEARSVHFGVDAPDASYIVNADAGRLLQVFWNLLKNAIKFTPRGGCVGIRCRRLNGTAVVEVNDSGVGIEPEVLPRLFNAFEQGERSVTRRFGGLGLGLAITKSLVEMHGGSIVAHSEGKGKGATFRVSLPIVTAVPQSAEPPAAPEPPTRPLRILLVEDHGDTARIMKRLLQAKGHEVQLASDLATAVEAAQQETFDLLVSDLGLPDGSGLDLMRQLVSRGKAMPAIALSGYGQDQDIVLSRAAGFAAHLTKPVNIEQLLHTIATVIGKDSAPRLAAVYGR